MSKIEFYVRNGDLDHLERVDNAVRKFEDYCFTRKEKHYIGDNIYNVTRVHSSVPNKMPRYLDNYVNWGKCVYQIMKSASLRDALVVLDDMQMIHIYMESLQETYLKEFLEYVEGLTELFPEENVEYPDIQEPLPEEIVTIEDERKYTIGVVEDNYAKPWYKFW